jgi:hypothetical protein
MDGRHDLDITETEDRWVAALGPQEVIVCPNESYEGIREQPQQYRKAAPFRFAIANIEPSRSDMISYQG